LKINKQLKYRDEFLRKLIHLFDSIIPLSLFFIERETLLIILLPITITFIFLDFSRHYISFIGKTYSFLFDRVTRNIEKQKNNITGATYYLVGCLFTIYFFKDVSIIMSSLLIMSISDSVAALIGRSYGRTEIYKGKTLEGSFSFLLSTIIILSIFSVNLNLYAVVFISIIIMFVELFSSDRINDNLTIPICSAILLQYFL
jgi:dolichol kinase